MRLHRTLAALLVVGGLGSTLRIANGADGRTALIRPSAQPVDRGEAVYLERCAICHGAEGDGSGPAAVNLDPKPRDFRRGWFKIRSTASGQLPTDQDLIRVIGEGMPGTTMQAWGEVLSEAEIAAVAAYVKSFSGRFERESPEPVAVSDAPGGSAERIERGAQLYAGVDAECIVCHGVAGRGDGPSAAELTDDLGDPIVPADLSMPWQFRGGPSVADIYLRLKTGLTGSPMPSYNDVLNDEQLWDLAYYVDSLGPDQAPDPTSFFLIGRVEGSLPTDPHDPRWDSAEEGFYPLAGQVMREPRDFTPAISGLWIRGLHDGSQLALRLRWHDRFHDQGDLSDGLSVILPAKLPGGDQRPYFVFGEPGLPVNLWLWSAAAQAVEEHNATGVGSLEAQSQQDLAGQATYRDGEYTLVLRRSLETGDPDDLIIPPAQFVPIAFAAADGHSREALDSGSIGTWQLIYLEGERSNAGLVAVPVVVGLVGLLEWAVVRRVRRSGSNSLPS